MKVLYKIIFEKQNRQNLVKMLVRVTKLVEIDYLILNVLSLIIETSVLYEILYFIKTS